MVKPVFLPDDMVFAPIEGGPGDPKPKVKVTPKPYDLDAELKNSYKNVISFDNKPAIDIVKSAATTTGVNPALLFSSAYQEGMNKAILKPNEVSEAYNVAEKKGLDTKTYPVDGFYNYGLDTFADKWDKLKKYLPAGFEQNFKAFAAKNEKGEPIKTAAFKTNESALMAKAAMLKLASDEVGDYAKKAGITIDPKDSDYFTLARYNTSLPNVQKMLTEYSKAKDKKKFIENGGTAFKQVHNNISPRLKRIKLIQQLLDTP